MKHPRAHPRAQRRAYRRGFTLIELLCMLLMFGLIALAGGRLFESAIRMSHSGAETQNDNAAFDAAVGVLRSDTWSATQFDVAEDRAATLKLPGDRKITWTLKDGSLTRSDGAQTLRWSVSPGITFAIDGPALVLRIPQTKTMKGGEVRVVSQIQLLARASS